ncbi:HAD-like domain-containing protein [Lophiotrema nucula]|uniref:HAD-like domain-containing protein n=1 Tax=Lophiotrema nucula TaxID=690887 RepID=A0A6A5Z8V4_9PLEO|nr:HAD-like domain-containing protein [Lophiotrema nucula]
MTEKPVPRGLLFDVFGTVVDWRSTVTRALEQTAHKALNDSTKSLATSVRLRASELLVADWGTFAQQWRNTYKVFCKSIAADPSLPWKTVDEHHLAALNDLIAEWKLEGLWTPDEIKTLSLIWHHLDPWPDSSDGIKALNTLFSTATLSNGNISLLEDLKKHGHLPFTHIFSAELFGSYKPNSRVYLGAVEKLGLEPNEVALVAAHLNDLQAAKSNGLQAIYVERPQEEDWDTEQVEKVRTSGWVDLWVKQDEKGFLTVAEKLGVQIVQDPNSTKSRAEDLEMYEV